MKARDYGNRCVGRNFKVQATLKNASYDRKKDRVGRRTYFGSLLLATLLVIVLASVQPWVDPRWLFLDGQTVGELSGDCCHVYDGAFSMLGIMIWSATASLACLSAIVLHRVGQRKEAVFALQAMILSGVLAIDDAYLFHEVVFPKVGVPQKLVLVAIASLALAYLVSNVRRLMRHEAWLLFVSLSAFAFSVGIDQVYESIEPIYVVVEDGAKLLGIVAWFLFHLNAFADTLVSAVTDTGTPPHDEGLPSCGNTIG